MKDIRESDWKYLRQLKPVLLDRFCSRVLSDIGNASSASAATSHERYLKVYALVQKEDKALGRLFDDLKRSNAVSKLFFMRRAGLITDEEWARFSEEMRSAYTCSQDF